MNTAMEFLTLSIKEELEPDTLLQIGLKWNFLCVIHL